MRGKNPPSGSHDLLVSTAPPSPFPDRAPTILRALCWFTSSVHVSPHAHQRTHFYLLVLPGTDGVHLAAIVYLHRFVL